MLFVRQKLVVEFPNIVSVYILRNTGFADIVTGETILMYGKETICEKLLGYEFEIAPKSFFQTNSLGAEKLYEVARSMIRFKKENGKSGTLLDLYAGTGTIGIILSPLFEKVYSVELVKDASADAARNAEHNKVAGFTAVCGKVEEILLDFTKENIVSDTIVIDPPRDGMFKTAPENILAFHAREIVYVSCNPSTLARDLALLIQSGEYQITDVTAVDMFPHTHHIETVVRLERKVG